MPIRNPRQAEQERVVFEAFLGAHPAFGAIVEAWEQPDAEFPDIRVELRSGGDSIEFELTEWLHGEQMAHAMRLERLIGAIDNATQALGPNVSSYVYTVMLVLRENGSQRVDPADVPRFRDEMKRLLQESELRWPTEWHWHSPQGRHVSAFQDLPCLGKYCSRVVLYPLAPRGRAPLSKRPTGIPWIFISRATSYSPSEAMEALKGAMSAKAKRYGPLRVPVRLLVHYGRAAAYNTPFIGVAVHEFKDVAEEAVRMVADQGAFEKIYLLSALEPGLEAYEIFPGFLKCV